jgi:16S rRNA (cytosine1402-N4)-methyltransferase
MAEREPERVHTSVLRDEVVAQTLEALARVRASGGPALVVDVTLGAGGHAQAVLEAAPGARLLGLDQDPAILDLARARLSRFGERAQVVHARFSRLPEVLFDQGLTEVACVVADLGVSSLQLDEASRGFSFLTDGPLDMRMDPTRTRTAADIVNAWDEDDLADLFYHEGGETRSRRIARAIVEGRRRAPFLRTSALAETIVRALGPGGRAHPATRTFQALRRAVNEEGDELAALLWGAEDALAHGGRLVALSFHSGEDGQVKRFLQEGARDGRWRLPFRRPLAPEREEVLSNPRARSARLRVGERTRRAGERREERP